MPILFYVVGYCFIGSIFGTLVAAYFWEDSEELGVALGVVCGLVWPLAIVVVAGIWVGCRLMAWAVGRLKGEEVGDAER